MSAFENAAQEPMETVILDRIEDGSMLPGTYPPNAAAKGAYKPWREQRDG